MGGGRAAVHRAHGDHAGPGGDGYTGRGGCGHRAAGETDGEVTMNPRQKNPDVWSADWPERIVIEPVEGYLKKKGKPPLTDLQRELLESIRQEALRTGLPPYASISLKKQLKKITPVDNLYSLMGIPFMKQDELAYWKTAWSRERKRLGMKPLEPQNPGWQYELLKAQQAAKESS